MATTLRIRPRRLLLVSLMLLGALALYRRGGRPSGGPKGADERPAAPPSPAASSTLLCPAPTAMVTPRPASGARTIARGAQVLHGAWGAGAGQFGRRRDPESNPEAPMALAAGAAGELAIVDQVNRRVQRFSGGRPGAAIALGGDTAQDLALMPGGRTVVLDRLGDRNVQLYDAAGALGNEIALGGPGVPAAGNVTGVFADDGGIYVERGHGPLVRIADGSGNSDPNRAELAGRPSRDGTLLISAALVDAALGTVAVRALDRKSGRPVWWKTVQLPAPLLHIVLLDSDVRGHVYLGAADGHESAAPPYVIVDEAITIVRLTSSGAPAGSIDLPPRPSADETLRPLSVDDEGTIYEMVPGPGGLDILSFHF